MNAPIGTRKRWTYSPRGKALVRAGGQERASVLRKADAFKYIRLPGRALRHQSAGSPAGSLPGGHRDGHVLDGHDGGSSASSRRNAPASAESSNSRASSASASSTQISTAPRLSTVRPCVFRSDSPRSTERMPWASRKARPWQDPHQGYASQPILRQSRHRARDGDDPLTAERRLPAPTADRQWARHALDEGRHYGIDWLLLTARQPTTHTA